jgi:uncharacterized membrane protein (DUF485 family)
MRQNVLKALANPPRIFYVPYSIAVLNFVVQFILFICAFMIGILANGITSGKMPIDIWYFLISMMVTHSILAWFSRREPQLANIIAAKIQLFKFRVPDKLEP